MKKRLFFIITFLLLTAVIIWFGVFRQSGYYSPGQAIPENALFSVKTSSFSNVYDKLSPNVIWQSLKKYPYFQEYHRNIELTDSLGKAYPGLRHLITDRPFALSLHRLSDTATGLLFICDLQKMNVLRNFEGLLANLTKDYGILLENTRETIRVLRFKDYHLFYTIKNNLLIGSFSRELVEASLTRCEKSTKTKGEKYSDDIIFELNHKELAFWLNTFLSTPSSSHTSSLLDSTSFCLNLKKDEMILSGSSFPDSSTYSFLDALKNISGGIPQIRNIAGDNTASYVSFCFSSFPKLKDKLLQHLQQHQPLQYQTFNTALNKTNKLLKIDVFEIFTSWIGEEIAFIKPQCNNEQQLQAIILAIRCNDRDLAYDQLNYLSEQIRLHTPVKFRRILYNGYEINYLSLKGFFRLFAGGLFDRLEKPYYTIIGDYVLFSNSPSALTLMIKKYILGQTLSNNEKYNRLESQFGKKSNLYVYVNTSNIYHYLYSSLSPQSRSVLKANKGAALGFENIGLEFLQDEDHFKIRMIAGYNPQAPEESEIQEINEQFEQLADDIESGHYQPAIPDSISVSTLTDYTWKTEDFIMRGRLKDGEPDGFWNIYTPSHQLSGQFPYKNGKPEGVARLFYADNKVKAEILYKEGNIGSYHEYFPDGTLRLEMEYRRGKRHGNARMYYSTGHLFCQGKYKKGKRYGTWQYYKVTGEQDRKIKFTR